MKRFKGLKGFKVPNIYKSTITNRMNALCERANCNADCKGCLFDSDSVQGRKAFADWEKAV